MTQMPVAARWPNRFSMYAPAAWRATNEAIYLAGIDDTNYYRVDNIEKAASEIPDGMFSILLSHTPEVYRQAAHAGFDLFLGGHTHGGQICTFRQRLDLESCESTTEWIAQFVPAFLCRYYSTNALSIPKLH